jgi:putative flavoprotein involved in K+ transport
MERVDVLVVGGGPAGLSVSHELSGHGIEHLVLERGRVGQAWRDRWDSFCLVTPNWSVRLPGMPYAGADEDGFMPRDAIVAHLAAYAGFIQAPIREGVSVEAVESTASGFVARTSQGDVAARLVVVCSGAFREAHRPAAAAALPGTLRQLDLREYRNEAELPPGRVIIVGSGQSGCQLAEELHEAGREVVLSCGRAPWAARRLGDRDLVWWNEASGFLDQPAGSLPPSARLAANILASGHGGGHDLHLRVLRQQGVTLVGHLVGASAHDAWFAPDLAETLAWSDARHRELMDLFARTAERLELAPLDVPEPPAFDPPSPERIPLEGVAAVIFAGGFRPDYRSWLRWPDAFDADGFPFQQDGTSSVVPGLFFSGVHFMRKRKSSTLMGVGEDAAIVARSVATRLARG